MQLKHYGYIFDSFYFSSSGLRYQQKTMAATSEDTYPWCLPKQPKVTQMPQRDVQLCPGQELLDSPAVTASELRWWLIQPQTEHWIPAGMFATKVKQDVLTPKHHCQVSRVCQPSFYSTSRGRGEAGPSEEEEKSMSLPSSMKEDHAIQLSQPLLGRP